MDLDGLAFLRKGNALLPSDTHADEAMASIKDGKEVLVTIRRPRSVQQHRRFFAMLRRLIESGYLEPLIGQIGIIQDEDGALKWIKQEVGHVERTRLLTGLEVFTPRSIDFASMPQDKFQRFQNRVEYVLLDKYGIDVKEMMGDEE